MNDLELRACKSLLVAMTEDAIYCATMRPYIPRPKYRKDAPHALIERRKREALAAQLKHDSLRDDATHWLLKGQDFPYICGLLGLRTDRVREQLLQTYPKLSKKG